jgi:hypothetical protein
VIHAATCDLAAPQSAISSGSSFKTAGVVHSRVVRSYRFLDITCSIYEATDASSQRLSWPDETAQRSPTSTRLIMCFLSIEERLHQRIHIHHDELLVKVLSLVLCSLIATTKLVVPCEVYQPAILRLLLVAMSIHFFCRRPPLPLPTASTSIGMFGLSAALHYTATSYITVGSYSSS